MKPSEAVPLLADAEATIGRIRDGLYQEMLAPTEDAARGFRIDVALEIFALQRTVDGLARRVGSKKRRASSRTRHPADEPRAVGVVCDRCGAAADRYGDCLSGSHVERMATTG